MLEELVYAAYGANMNLAQMRRRCPTARKLGTGIIRGYELLFKGRAKGRAYATIESKEGGTVPVVVFSLKPGDVARLDEYEDFPRLYRKEELSVLMTGKGDDGREEQCPVKVFVYIMNGGRLQAPGKLYFHSILEGYEQNGIDPAPLFEALAKSQEG